MSLGCLCSHALYTGGRIMPVCLNTLTRKKRTQNNEIFLKWNNKSLNRWFYIQYARAFCSQNIRAYYMLNHRLRHIYFPLSLMSNELLTVCKIGCFTCNSLTSCANNHGLCPIVHASYYIELLGTLSRDDDDVDENGT